MSRHEDEAPREVERDVEREVERAQALLGQRDPAYVAAVMPLLRLAMRTYFRSEVHGMEQLPDGGVLLVSNHSGGLTPMDVPILAVALADEFGPERPLHVLAHDLLLAGPTGAVMRRFGFLPASRANAEAALRGGSVTIVFPGGDRDTFRPFHEAGKIDFGGRTGYVRTALEAGVPIVPAVSIGGQETQLFLTRGERLGRLLRMDTLVRSRYFPVVVGFPWGLALAFPPALPLPSKIVTRVLAPIDVEAEFGPDPDVAAVDREVRARMQAALDELGRARRFPVLG